MTVTAIVLPTIASQESINYFQQIQSAMSNDLDFIFVFSSTDSSLADAYKKYFPHSQIIGADTSSKYNAWNAAISYASGDYLLFMEEDYYYDENTLKEMMELCDLYSSDLIISKTTSQSKASAPDETYNSKISRQTIIRKEDPELLFEGRVSNKLFRKSIIDQAKLHFILNVNNSIDENAYYKTNSYYTELMFVLSYVRNCSIITGCPNIIHWHNREPAPDSYIEKTSILEDADDSVQKASDNNQRVITKFELIRRYFYSICSALLPINKNKVLFLSDIRENIGGNYKPIYPLLKERGFKITTDFTIGKTAKGPRLHRLKRAFNLATAKYIVLEDVHSDMEWIKVRKNQKLIQLWHAAGAFKQFGLARAEVDHKIHINTGYSQMTGAIVSSEMIRSDYANSFGIDISKVYATGIPRTDIFFDEQYMQGVRSRFEKKYPILKGKKILLFCPTYRGKNIKKATYDATQFDPARIHSALGDDYVIVFKWHPAHVAVMKKNQKVLYSDERYSDYTIDLSGERDINELLIIADLIITDYSSIIFEYELLNKPVIYYWYDIIYYKMVERGFYYDFADYVYGPIAYNLDQLEVMCKNITTETYEKERERFHEKFMSACDGKSSEKVVNTFFSK